MALKLSFCCTWHEVQQRRNTRFHGLGGATLLTSNRESIGIKCKTAAKNLLKPNAGNGEVDTIMVDLGRDSVDNYAGFCIKTLRVQVPNNHILTQNLY